MAYASRIAAASVLVLGGFWAGFAVADTDPVDAYPMTLDFPCLNVVLNLDSGHWHSDELMPLEWLRKYASPGIDGPFIEQGNKAEFVAEDQSLPFTRFDDRFDDESHKVGCLQSHRQVSFQ